MNPDSRVSDIRTDCPLEPTTRRSKWIIHTALELLAARQRISAYDRAIRRWMTKRATETDSRTGT